MATHGILQKGTAAGLEGFPVLPIDHVKLLGYLGACVERGVGYDLGAKDHDLGTYPPHYSHIDCSGFVRSILAYATNGASLGYGMPDGSYLQGDWFKAKGFKGGDYHAYLAHAPLHDNLVRVAIARASGRGGESVGHVWIILNGQTIESYGGHGPGRRAWNYHKLLEIVDEVYVIGE